MKEHIVIFLLPILLFSAYAVHCGQHDSLEENVDTIAFCEVVQNPDSYDGRKIRVRAILDVGPEQQRLYDPECMGDKTSTWVEFDGAHKQSSAEVRQQLEKILDADGRAFVVVVGRFDGPRKFEVPEGIDPKLAEFLKQANSRYGHLNGYRFQFVIVSVEQVEPVPADVPWFKWDTPEGPRLFPLPED